MSAGCENDLREIYGVSDPIQKKYRECGVVSLFDWQIDCLTKLKDDPSRNLLYSAPTSSGKTLIAEYLCIRTILKERKKALFVLPFISVTNEKMLYYQRLLASSSGIVVEGFMGSHGSYHSLANINFAICTIEKANSFLNKLIEDHVLDMFGIIVIDEMHMIGEGSRGVTLEMILTKLKYLKLKGIHIQIVGMSATLPNLKELADWLEAELYITNFRPIPLKEHYVLKNTIYNIDSGVIERTIAADSVFDQICRLCLETIRDSGSVLIFCQTKNQCENLAKKISIKFRQLGCDEKTEWGKVLRTQITADKIIELLAQLKSNVTGFDLNLLTPVAFGVAYHHAGLTMNEREILENAFRRLTIRVLVATTTLSSGVNLPARRVIIRSLMGFNRVPIAANVYRQMIGRAGRMGKDATGESFLMVKEDERNVLTGFLRRDNQLRNVESSLNSDCRLFARIVLEAVASEMVADLAELERFLGCTFAAFDADVMFKALKLLCDYQLVQKVRSESDNRWSLLSTSFGKACLASSLDPFYAIEIYNELDRAKKSIALDSDLHLIYLLVPISSLNMFENCSETLCRIDWILYKSIFRNLDESHLRVANLIGVNDDLLNQLIANERKVVVSKNGHDIVKMCKRFLVSLALQDLVNEKSLNEVAKKFNCGRGLLQGLQNSASMFSGMTQIFCSKLRWKNLELLIKQFEDRFMFGVEQELLELLKLPVMNAFRARTLFNSGLESVNDLIQADAVNLAKTISNSVPFEVRQKTESATSNDKTKLKYLWLECLNDDDIAVDGDADGDCDSLELLIAKSLIRQAKDFRKHEIGCVDINWDRKSVDNSKLHYSQTKRLSMSDCFDCSDLIAGSTKNDSLISESSPVKMPRYKRRRKNDSLIIKRHKTASDCSFKTEVKNISSTADDKNEKPDSETQQSHSQPLFDDSETFDEFSIGGSSTLLSNEQRQRKQTDPAAATAAAAMSSTKRACIAQIEIVNVCDNREYFECFGEFLRTRTDRLTLSITSCFLTKTEIVFAISLAADANNLTTYLLQTTALVESGRILELVRQVFRCPNFKVICFDCKSFVCDWDFETKCQFSDPKIANWILNPSNKPASLFQICENYAKDCMDYVKQIRTSNSLPIAAKSCCIQSFVVYRLMDTFDETFSEQPELSQSYDQEMAFMTTLISMEKRGIKIDVELLQKIQDLTKSMIKTCTQKANELNGHPIELSRKKLIEKMIRMKAKRELNCQLLGTKQCHDPIELLGQEYRTLNAMLLKVINPLIRNVNVATGLVHGNYSIYTKTGRVTIQEPGLQHVPKNMRILLPETVDAIDCDKKTTNISLRAVFLPRDSFVFLAADFCQLELRLLAHFSRDAQLMASFRGGAGPGSDPFVCLAAKWFRLDRLADVNDEQRQQAKQLCYGMLYGMGVETLTSKLKMRSKKDASSFLNQFRRQFPGIQTFIEDCKLKCRTNKYLKTIGGRKQQLEHIDSEKLPVRLYAERQAVNNLIQGSAADIVKTATVRVDRMLTRRFPQLAYLVLHIHDELIFEVSAANAAEIREAIETELQSAYTLDSGIPLPVKLKMGKTWNDLKPVA